MVLHTFETDPDPNPSPHLHVHLTVKAAGLDGIRLNLNIPRSLLRGSALYPRSLRSYVL